MESKIVVNNKVNTYLNYDKKLFFVNLYGITVMQFDMARKHLSIYIGQRTALTKNTINKYLPKEFKLRYKNRMPILETPYGEVSFKRTLRINIKKEKVMEAC
jgi:hypothetical protein